MFWAPYLVSICAGMRRPNSSNQQHRNIPGYPTVSRDNDYLFARQDGAIIDAKPWGMGPGTPGTPWPLLSQETPTRWTADLADQQALQQVQWDALAETCEVREGDVEARTVVVKYHLRALTCV